MKEMIPEFWQSLSDFKKKKNSPKYVFKVKKNPFRIMLGLLETA